MTAATGRAGGAPRGAPPARGRRAVGRVDARARLALLARSGWADARLARAEPARDHRQHDHRQHARADERRPDLRRHGALLDRDLRERDEQRQRGRRVERGLDTLDRRQLAPEPQEHRAAPHDHHEREERQRQQRGRDDGVDVQAHAGAHEEHRHEHAPRDRVELLLQRLDVAGRPASQHHAADERAQHRVEAQARGEREQHDEQQHREAQRALAGPVLRRAEEAVAAECLEAPQPARQRGQRDRDDREQDEQDRRDPALARPEQHGHGDDRAELAHRADHEHRTAEPRAELTAVAQDGEHHAERRRRERDRPRRDGVRRVVTDDREDEHGADDERRQPRRSGPPSDALAQEARLELVPGQEEEEAHAEVREERDVVGRGEVERGRPDEDAAQQQHDDLRDARPHGHEAREQRRQQGDDEHRHERGVDVHGRLPVVGGGEHQDGAAAEVARGKRRAHLDGGRGPA